jgi:hypothetical protein
MTAAVLRPLSVGEILDTSFQVYRRHFAALMPVMLICYGPTVLLEVFMEAAGGVAARLVLMLVSVLAAIILSALATGAAVFVISEGYLGQPTDGPAALRRTMPYLGRLVFASFAFGLLSGVGALFLLVPGIIVACALSVTWPALVLESLPTADAGLRRSWELTKGNRGRVFVVGVLLFVIFFVPFMGVGTLVALLAGLTGSSGGAAMAGTVTVITALLVGLVKLLVYPFFNCVLTILYYDLRVRREGFDLELLATTLKSA